MNNKEGRVYLVGGVNGVGKSSLLQEISANYPEFEVFKGSAKFMEWLGLPPGDYKALQELPDDYKNLEVCKMMMQIFKSKPRPGKTLLIDAHYFNYKQGALIDATGEWVSFLDALFVVLAPPETILQRLELDQTTKDRARDILPPNADYNKKIEMLYGFIQATINKAQELSQKYKIPYFLINNGSEGFGHAVEEFLGYHAVIDSNISSKINDQK